MSNEKMRVLRIAAVALVIGGCGGGGGSGPDGAAIVETAASDGAAAGNVGVGADGPSLTEVTGVTQTSDGVATGVPAISSAQMDGFVKNPLTSSAPIELNGGATNVASSDFIINPLMN